MKIQKFYDAYGIKPDTSETAYFTGTMDYPVINNDLYFKLLDVILEHQCNFTLYYGVYSTRQQILNELTRNSKIYYKEVRTILGVN